MSQNKVTMQLTAYTNYALRMLMYCGLQPNRTVRIEEIAQAHGISRPHLLKAARQLGHLGYLETIRGRGGGIRLGKPADKIVIGHVVRHTEGDIELVECFNEATNSCPLIGVCKLSNALRSALAAFFSELDQITIADLVMTPAPLLERLLPSVPTNDDHRHSLRQENARPTGDGRTGNLKTY